MTLHAPIGSTSFHIGENFMSMGRGLLRFVKESAFDVGDDGALGPMAFFAHHIN